MHVPHLDKLNYRHAPLRELFPYRDGDSEARRRTGLR